MKVKIANYIGYRVKGSITVKGRTEAKRKENFEKKLQELLEKEYPSFFQRNLSDVMKQKVLLGVEQPIKKNRQESKIDYIKYTNVKNGLMKEATPEKERKWVKEEKKRMKGKRQAKLI